MEGILKKSRENVDTTTRLFHYQVDIGIALYNDLNNVLRAFDYLSYKARCMQEQRAEGINIDVRLAEECYHNLKFISEDNKEDKPFSEKAKNRANIFKSFLECKDKNDKVYATAHGFTNTLRLRHSKPIVNLPSIDKYGGKEIRSLLTVPSEDYVMCKTDIKCLEDKTKQHYIKFFDLYYQDEVNKENFDPHIDIGIFSGILTKKDAIFFKEYNGEDTKNKDRYDRIKKIREKAKTVNFSAIYGAGPLKISKTLKCSLSEAKKLHSAYWKRNKAIKQISKQFKVKSISTKRLLKNGKYGYRKENWIQNPVSGIWLLLRAEKDMFSVVNQSTGVYFFDTYLKYVRNKLKPLGISIIMQYHDEILFVLKKSDKSIIESLLRDSINSANKELKLNVLIDISINFGNNYFECH